MMIAVSGSRETGSAWLTVESGKGASEKKGKKKVWWRRTKKLW